MQELGKLWGELFSVVWSDVCKRILKMQRGEKKPKHTFEQLQAEQSRAGHAEGLGFRTLPRRSSCSDLWAHRSCHRAMLCLSWHRLRAWKRSTSVAVRTSLEPIPSLPCPERAQHRAPPAPQPSRPSPFAFNDPFFDITTGSEEVRGLCHTY